MENHILIINFGSQFTQLIARRIREIGVYCEIIPFDQAESYIRTCRPKGIILSGGPASVIDHTPPQSPEVVFTAGIPVLGICFGQQTMCQQLGGQVTSEHRREFGSATLHITQSCPLFAGIWNVGEQKTVLMSHGDSVSQLPPGFQVVAHSKSAPYAAIFHQENHFYGIQFHPEVVRTPDGSQLLKNFVLNIANCHPNWTMANFRVEAIKSIKNQVGSGKVLCGLSGGVDSSVAAALIQDAIGDNLTCVFVDTGLMRKNESQEVIDVYSKKFHNSFIHIDAADIFLSALEGIEDPEQKRKIIGKTFIDIFEREASKIGSVDFLAQGTLYPDVIESIASAGDTHVTIKSHHNVGGLPERMNLKLIEPLRELFKDEVRALGSELGLPASMVGRHPFPGPGLAIRIPGALSDEKLAILRHADAIYIEEIRNATLYDDIWQAFAVLLPVRTVGVMGDNRTYEYVCALRAVTSTDGMTADYYPFDHKFLNHVSMRIINEVQGINRVVYDITSKPPGTIEWE